MPLNVFGKSPTISLSKLKEILILFQTLILPFVAIGVDSHPVWNEEEFQSYPEIMQLSELRRIERVKVRRAIGKLYTINLSTSIMSEEDVLLMQNLTDLIKNTTTYLEAIEAAYNIFRILCIRLDKMMAFELETKTFERSMLTRQLEFESLKVYIDLTLIEFLEEISVQRFTLEMPEFVPSDRKYSGETTGSFATLMQTDISFITLTDQLLILVYNELKLKDCIWTYEEMYQLNGRTYCS